MASFEDIVPYQCVFIDAAFKDLLLAMRQCFVPNTDRDKLSHDLKQLFSSPANTNSVLPCLSVRTGLDLYLRVMNFPKGSEIIMSAINIPDMVHVIRHHGIKVVPLDVSIDTCGAKTDIITSLISDKTVAILIAHIYGKSTDMEPIIQIAQKHNIPILEDCAETFTGLQQLGHPASDICFFSFGVIKYYTAFGGAILKVKDTSLYDKMSALYSSYPIRSQKVYLKKVIKYSMAYIVLNCPKFIRPGSWILRYFNINYKKHVVSMLRGFPGNLVTQLRYQPSDALLHMLHHRLSHFDQTDFDLSRVKGDYVSERLPETVCQVGSRAHVPNYWLFPIIVDEPDDFLKRLNDYGIDAYRGATQLNIIEPTNGDSPLKSLDHFVTHYPHEAKYLIDHIVYLPVNKMVPFSSLDRICDCVKSVLGDLSSQRLPRVKVKSKL